MARERAEVREGRGVRQSMTRAEERRVVALFLGENTSGGEHATCARRRVAQLQPPDDPKTFSRPAGDSEAVNLTWPLCTRGKLSCGGGLARGRRAREPRHSLYDKQGTGATVQSAAINKAVKRGS